ncbi:MAG: Unknown protein [uncultured Sulfurovum sp.]|uniref:Uncharacterized protein n=1 Tax=uncultured Sulfurovum sp. TaxID=269237 RepID=A0A6S6TAD9_9BACT|nr:MAG: Unknown protein [uncultured Sulfurovum sp.]
MFKMKLFPIQKIVKDAGFGASVPIIIQANNTEYLLKTKEDGMQPYSLGIFNELLAYQLIDYLDYDITPQEVVFLYIDNNFLEMAEVAYKEGIIKEESYQNIVESLGVNIGIEYLHNAMEPLDGKINNNKFIQDIVHIDNYMMNCDRTEKNINILQDKKDLRRYYAIDFGNALSDGILYEKILENSIDIFSTGTFSECNVTLSNRYILKEETKKLVKKGRINKDNISTIRQVLSDIIDTFPPEWKPIEYKDAILDVVSTRLKSRKIFNREKNSQCECLY